MGRPRKEELRELKEEEQKELKRVVKATSERVDAVKRAKARLSVAAGATLTAAGQEAGLSREAVDQTATWELLLLRAAIRKTDLPQIAAETIREVLREAG